MDQNFYQETKHKKRFLYRYRNNKECLSRLEEKLALLEQRITSVGSSKLSGMPRGGTPVTVADLLSDKEILEERIKKLKVKNKVVKKSILEEIDSLENMRHSEVLELYFIDCLSFEDISESLGYSVRHVIRLYGEAINELVHSSNIAVQ